MGQSLEERRQYSSGRLDELVARASALESIRGDEKLCIYITGSFGRLEAGRDSDLDLFFLYGADDPEADMPRIPWYRLAAALIDLAAEMGFPPFSKDGRYLEVHNVARMGRDLGSPVDDSENRFTARMLLLLESRPVLDAPLYRDLMARVVDFYYEDFDRNAAAFRPTYLVNDILRFWRTLCLNYEHARNRRRRESEASPDFRIASAIDNIKLRFSRLTTCFSMVASLAASPTPITADRVLELTRLSPTERWEAMRAIDGVSPIVTALLEHYDGFLAMTADKTELEARLESSEERAKARDEASRYGELVADLLQQTAQAGQLRYLLI